MVQSGSVVIDVAALRKWLAVTEDSLGSAVCGVRSLIKRKKISLRILHQDGVRMYISTYRVGTESTENYGAIVAY